jgi:alkanesulfonate monooxygenase SsuD/methylene tetrahydromethanopterin reductase-like flavin-dependent oxidoreductase (luciferase family)
MLDDGLIDLSNYWSGALEPPPVQRPRIPIWVAARWPSRKPLRRAARWDGLFPIELPGPDALATLAAELRELRRGRGGHFDLVAEIPPGADPTPWNAAGATWVLTSFDSQPREANVRSVIEAGP